MATQERNAEGVSLYRSDTPYPAMLLIGRLDASAGGAATFDFQSIPAFYSKLIVDLYARGGDAVSTRDVMLLFNGDLGANYDTMRTYSNAAGETYQELRATNFIYIASIAAASSPANVFDACHIEINAYANAVAEKVAHSDYGFKVGTGANNFYTGICNGWWRSTAVINRVTLYQAGGGVFAQYSTARLYGVY
jgi:hypothetical protein